MPRRLTPVALVAVLMLSGCAPAPSGAEPAPAPGSDAVPADGVTELAAPALHLTTLAPDGAVSHLDLASGRSSTIARIAPADAVAGDGRYLFALREGSVTIVDSGAWTWNHGDHVHYYSGPARVVGDVEGPGTPTVVAGERSVGISFDGGGGPGEAVLVKVAPLADGEIEELFRRDAAAAAGAAGMVVPLAYGAWVTEVADGRVARLRHVDEEGVAGEAVRCADAAGSIATAVGVVVACADGVVLAADGRPAQTERLDYPAADDRVRAFSGREGRPSVAALTDGGAVWVLDTRARAWHAWRAASAVTAVAAVGDDADHVVAVSRNGEVRVHHGTTGRLLSTVAASGAPAHVPALFPEQRQTYVVDPAGAALVVDHGSGAVLARFTLPDGLTVLTGR